MSKQTLKEVEALRTGTYDGHRRRRGVRFLVDANAKESWFFDVGPAPEGAELPAQLQNAQAPRGKSFVDVMAQLGQPQPPTPVAPVEQTLREAAATLPVVTSEQREGAQAIVAEAADANQDLVG